jgi:hypothetical protein
MTHAISIPPVTAQDSIKDLFAQKPQFVPTSPRFAIKAQKPNFNAIGWHDHGILTTHPIFGSYIRGMPLLWQADPGVNTTLDAYLATVPVDKMPKKDGLPFTPHQMREAMKGVGCYDTSIVTVIIAALFNRTIGRRSRLINRTGIFDAIPAFTAPGLAEVPKEVMQLAWHYQQVFKAQNGILDRGKTVQPMYFSEVVADIGGGKVVESCDPYVMLNCKATTLANGDASSFFTWGSTATELTNSHIIDLMNTGTVPMIAYSRHKPEVHINPITKALHVSFKDLISYHKVVFSGIPNDAKYPLLINDVGNRQRYHVRLSSNLEELIFDHPGEHSKQVVIDPAFKNRPFLIYQDEDKKTNPTILFVDHYEGLRIRSS